MIMEKPFRFCESRRAARTIYSVESRARSYRCRRLPFARTSWSITTVMGLLFVLQIVYPFSITLRRNVLITKSFTPSRLCTYLLSLSNDSSTLQIIQQVEAPHRTEAGGYTHTTASKAKISAANKGKVPWNKGIQRTDDVKARIAEGVRKRNREKFLLKLKEMNITEEEYENKKRQEHFLRHEEKQKRKTAQGGYRATEETKAKISSILKEKYANGEIKKKTYNGPPVRKGFTHSEETKEKIRATLRKKWAEDPLYQEKMKNATDKNSNLLIREKISQTLKEKWKEPTFRDKMMESIQKRQHKTSLNRIQREKISEAMKKKWQDAEYRTKAMLHRVMSAQDNQRITMNPSLDLTTVQKTTPKTKSMMASSRPAESSGIIALTPLKQKKTITANSKSRYSPSSIHSDTSNNNRTPPSTTSSTKSSSMITKKRKTKQTSVVMVQALTPNANKPLNMDMKIVERGLHRSTIATTTATTNGPIPSDGLNPLDSLDMFLSEEEEDERLDDDLILNLYSMTNMNMNKSSSLSSSSSSSSNTLDSIFGGADDDDENLENFDPYGLDNF